jgi:predicted ATP-dependent endonuclease of OLD family
MKINYLQIQNIKSIGNVIKLNFEKGINIFIGPNGSGKSNIIDILNTALHTYFIWHWHEKVEPFGKIIYQKQNLEGFFDLPRNFDINGSQQQEIITEIEFSNDDLENVKIIRENIASISSIEKILLQQQQSEIENVFKELFEKVSHSDLSINLKQIFEFKAQDLDEESANSVYNTFPNPKKLWFRYLNYFEKIKYLIEKFNDNKSDAEKINELKYIFKFFSPNRFHEGQQFEISLPGQSRTQKLKENKQKTTKNTTSDIAYSTYYFARIFNALRTKNQLLIEADKRPDTKKFCDDVQVKEVKELLTLVGKYDFDIATVNLDDNKFRFKVASGEQEIEFKNLSSGEKEILNFIFIVLALDLRDALILIDEPEIHLHPQWQNKLIKLFHILFEKRKIQFIISTHSPAFVNSETIANIIRVYKPAKETRIMPEEKNDEWRRNLAREADLIDIITYSNNAKLFFVNKVVLVEGITDEIIFSYLIKTLGNDKESIEIINVGGKDNFVKYIKFLNKFKIKPTVICDLDNLWDGELLENSSILTPLKSSIKEFWKQKVKDLNELVPYFKKETIKGKITHRIIGEKLLEIIKKIENGEAINADDQKFVELWLEKCIDKKKIFSELDIESIYTTVDTSIKNLGNICEKVKTEFKIEEIECPVYILEEGTIENYANEIGHDKNGALKLLKEIKLYMEAQRNNNPKIEGLKKIAQSIIR